MVVWDGARENKPRSRKAVARMKRRAWAKEENAAKQWEGKAKQLDDAESKNRFARVSILSYDQYSVFKVISAGSSFS